MFIFWVGQAGAILAILKLVGMLEENFHNNDEKDLSIH